MLLGVAAAAMLALPLAGAEAPEVGAKAKPFGLDQVVAFYGARKELKCVNFAMSGDWQYWKARGGVASGGITHQHFLQKSVEDASKVLAGRDFGDNPDHILTIDEFGWDYDGGIDQHTIDILEAVHTQRPDMKFAVWQMRGPVAPQLAAVYKDMVDLVMLETYYDLNDAWIIPFQLQTSRCNGIVDKTVIGLGLGKEAPHLGGYNWTRTPEELKQQLALIRFVAPESPGIAFFGSYNGKPGERAAQITGAQFDQIVGGFNQIPTDGSTLKPELQELGKLFTKRYDGPAIFCSNKFMMCYFHSGYDGGPWGSLHQPRRARVHLMNLGYKDAKGIKVTLKDLKDVNKVLGSTTVDIPSRSTVVALVPGAGGWTESANLVVEAPGGEVFNFTKGSNIPKK